ncbi:MAG: uracil-DNA glycosylase, partial [Neisseriaceae bacterium]|nr:uracil-DNA glycosylase [Neisseriaceae bacterium]
MKSWADAIGAEKQQPYFQKIIEQVNDERKSGQVIYPPAKDIFNAFRYTEFNQVKVVIIGQDP